MLLDIAQFGRIGGDFRVGFASGLILLSVFLLGVLIRFQRKASGNQKSVSWKWPAQKRSLSEKKQRYGAIGTP